MRRFGAEKWRAIDAADGHHEAGQAQDDQSTARGRAHGYLRLLNSSQASLNAALRGTAKTFTVLSGRRVVIRLGELPASQRRDWTIRPAASQAINPILRGAWPDLRVDSNVKATIPGEEIINRADSMGKS